MGNTTGTIKLPSSDNHNVIEANERLKKFLTKNPNLLIKKSPREISQLEYDQTGKPILNKKCLEQLCSSITQIIEESFEISSNIFDHGDNYRNRVIEEHFKDFKIQKIKIPFADCMGNPFSGNPHEIELTTSYIAVSKIIDIYNYICEVFKNSPLFANTLRDCLLDYNSNPNVSRNEVNKELSIFWDYNHEDPTEDTTEDSKKGGSKYIKRKTTNTRKGRKHSRRYRKSRRQMKSRRYRKK
jgi:hypothetical protein